eukprot:CAMPEP_0197016916 /NCGR_PEP_ID=MMETSP1380-20130617/79245_1 /TAXON_ID=5936 /ORGANISM="Euplotes crassus, Strain CT5" /LENGTH=84 /DNA_ID=CAMNT_0042443941 /DNA_START=1941 /DNA_END=2191 /DNA_ORIENTATION=-
MSFENHVHGFKRTKPLKGGKVAEGGTVYIGDGSWGPIIGDCKPNNRDLMDNNKKLHHVWHLEIEGSKLKGSALNNYGMIIDDFT